jgi:transcriptional regulator GlxA family with amidase domain
MAFPGTQGGPLMHVIAAKAVALREAPGSGFIAYPRRTLANAQAMVGVFAQRGYTIVSGGTDNHLFLVNLVEQCLTGREADAALGRAHITVNRNVVPNDPQPHPPGGEPVAHPRVKRAVHLMEQNPGRPLSLPALAERLELSVRHLQRLFKTQTGDTPYVYARRIRVRTAAWLLTSSPRTIADIAATCGFADASHFGRAFRKQYGMAPQRFREIGTTLAAGPAERAPTRYPPSLACVVPDR